jgi:hypothetical protein
LWIPILLLQFRHCAPKEDETTQIQRKGHWERQQNCSRYWQGKIASSAHRQGELDPDYQAVKLMKIGSYSNHVILIQSQDNRENSMKLWLEHCVIMRESRLNSDTQIRSIHVPVEWQLKQHCFTVMGILNRLRPIHGAEYWQTVAMIFAYRVSAFASPVVRFRCWFDSR